MQATEGCTWDETDHLGVKKCIEIAMTCVETDRKERPTTEKIIDELDKQDALIEKLRREDPKSLIGQVRICPPCSTPNLIIFFDFASFYNPGSPPTGTHSLRKHGPFVNLF